jgi:hypothetical protein
MVHRMTVHGTLAGVGRLLEMLMAAVGLILMIVGLFARIDERS